MLVPAAAWIDHSGEVMASWLFAQFLLTNEVQIAYSSTEGYLPVTSKAQNSPEYLDYLSKSGSNNDLYYDVKLNASKLLLENTDNTFVTPVFNGSASLRSAAGQLIEDVSKASRRKQVIDDEFMETLFSDTRMLFKLSEPQTDTALPFESKALLITLAAVWIIMGIYYITSRKKS